MDLSHGSRPIKSTLSNDPDMIELIQMYVEEMPERIAELERSWQGTRLDELTRFAHQLKGASAGYGFEQVGDAAAKLEQTLRLGIPDMERIKTELDELVSLCGRTIV